MMITHNMKDAIVHGNRLIMMNEGRIILDIEGEEKQHLTNATCSTSLPRSRARRSNPTKCC